ncbi:hypothetical protein [Aquimarina spongiae]|uniref:Uncharacterized protein n=1 Tax=Aquimarina spongiae TaxID=570521 RepID=A0A1M6A7X6_9FLAO|nr:hypothetical protein [Aquimarina spongiae]SHI32557.1 hypothetical protein SAMN04488508_101146 [Aquimarina spongiae]
MELDYIEENYANIISNLDCITDLQGMVIQQRDIESGYFISKDNNSCYCFFNEKKDSLIAALDTPCCFRNNKDNELLRTISCLKKIKAISLKVSDTNNISITINKNITFIKFEKLPKYPVNIIGNRGWYWYHHDVYSSEYTQ